MVVHGKSERTPPPRAWLLLSGGIDSTVCLAFYLKEKFHVECFHISYSQPASRHERAAAERVAHHFDVPLKILRWSGSAEFMAGEIVGRNAFLFLGALIEMEGNAGILAIGIHSGRMCCNFQKSARERLVGSTGPHLMQPFRTAC